MLLRFGVSNHGSIRDYQELSLVATNLKDSESGLLPVDDGESASLRKRLQVVPVVAVYGANAAGKSTVLKALDFFVHGVVWSHKRTASSEGTPHNPFLLDDESKVAPSRYDADFLIGDKRYHYGYSVDGKMIVSEWLYSFPLNSTRQTRTILFHRDKSEQNEFYFGKSLRGGNRQISKLTRPNSLFLSVAAQYAHEQLAPIYNFFFNGISRRLDETASDRAVAEQVSAYLQDNEERRRRVLTFLKAADTGITDIDFSKVPLGEKEKLLLQEFEQVISKHIDEDLADELGGLRTKDKTKIELMHAAEGGRSVPIPLTFESAGTVSLLQLLGPVFTRLSEGGILIVDELNNTLHPLVSRELIKLFSSPDTNPGKAQLVFTTHDTSMLMCGLLRRDQIWFTEKDRAGASYIYALSDIKIRGSGNFERAYINGRFGAVPLFGIRGRDLADLGVASELDRGGVQ